MRGVVGKVQESDVTSALCCRRSTRQRDVSPVRGGRVEAPPNVRLYVIDDGRDRLQEAHRGSRRKRQREQIRIGPRIAHCTFVDNALAIEAKRKKAIEDQEEDRMVW